MKTIAILLLSFTVLLWGCQSIDNKYITREEFVTQQQSMREDIENMKKDISVTRDIINDVNIEYLKLNATPIEDKKECAWFIPKVWDIVYLDLTDDEVANDDFYLQYWEIVRKSWRKYAKMEVFSYLVEWDCVAHINWMWPNRLNKI